MNLFVFDIETIPDVDAGRRLYDLEGLDDREVAEIMFHKQREASGNDFLRHHGRETLNRVFLCATISIGWWRSRWCCAAPIASSCGRWVSRTRRSTS